MQTHWKIYYYAHNISICVGLNHITNHLGKTHVPMCNTTTPIWAENNKKKNEKHFICIFIRKLISARCSWESSHYILSSNKWNRNELYIWTCKFASNRHPSGGKNINEVSLSINLCVLICVRVHSNAYLWVWQMKMATGY